MNSNPKQKQARPRPGRLLTCLLIIPLLFCLPAIAEERAGEWSGYLAMETRLFPDQGLWRDQKSHSLGLTFQPEYYKAWDNTQQSLTLIPFIRLDASDNKRTHIDLRELTWLKVGDDWELRAGVQRLFWGVTESRHLVDIINQTDILEGLDGEDKLGQPMIHLSLIRDWGTVDFLWMPLFRPRAHPGLHSRWRPALAVDDQRRRFESAAGRHHQDFAIRWSHTLDRWDIGLSHFYGTNRQPRYQTLQDSEGNPYLAPYYEIIHQTGMDLQATLESWIFKLEMIRQEENTDETHIELVGGFEYTFVGVFESDADIGLITEYLFDDRGKSAPHIFNNDLMIGLRLTLNDAQSTSLLLGAAIDLDTQSTIWSIEAERRLGDHYKLTLEGRALTNLAKTDPFYAMRRDHMFQLELARYF
ncbi:hypothetical protein ACQZV8_04220 [Magnetococcales bacterium HHB-1]